MCYYQINSKVQRRLTLYRGITDLQWKSLASYTGLSHASDIRPTELCVCIIALGRPILSYCKSSIPYILVIRSKVRVRERGCKSWYDFGTREVVETLLYKKSDNTVGVKDYIPMCSALSRVFELGDGNKS